MRQAFLKNIDSVTSSETEEIIARARERGNVINDIDIAVVGSGLQGSIAGIEMQAYKPDINVLYLDSGPKRGGGFGVYTAQAEEETPVFDINSRGKRT